MNYPVSIVTVTRNGFFFTQLLIEKIREFTGDRPYEIIAVDRGSSDGTRQWLKQQADVRFVSFRQWRTRGHGHAEAAERGIAKANYDRVVLIDSDAHPVGHRWLADTSDRLDEQYRLAGAVFVDEHRGNPHGWYIHAHFMSFFRRDLHSLIVLRKVQGEDVDVGEQATINVLAAGYSIIKQPILFCPELSVGHPRVPTTAGQVFHAWYVSRLENNEADVVRETNGEMTKATYLGPLVEKLRSAYDLSY